MIINSKLILIVVTLTLALAMVASPSIASALSRGELSNKNIEQNLATLESNNSETASAEFTTSFSKKGNTQNSPIAPECPKQGPIPPNCTMKPKF